MGLPILQSDSIPLEATVANEFVYQAAISKVSSRRPPPASRATPSSLASSGSGQRAAGHSLNQFDQVMNAQETFEAGTSLQKAIPPEVMLGLHSDVGVNGYPVPFDFFLVKTEMMRHRLTEAKKQARIRRLRISFPCIFIGLSLWCVCFGVGLYLSQFHHEEARVVVFFLLVIAVPSGLICLLGLLPEDQCAIRIAVCIAMLVHLLIASAMVRSIPHVIEEGKDNHCTLLGRVVPCSTSIIVSRIILYSVTALGLMFQVFRYIHSLFLGPRRMLQKLWSITGCILLFGSLWCLCQCFLATSVSFSIGRHDIMSFCTILLSGICLASGSFAMWPNFRFRAQAWLAAKGESAVSAAGVAVLLGASNIEDIIAASRTSFRAVSAEKLTEFDMADQTPNPALCDLTEGVVLGQVDAFVSHSWHDDPQSKWIDLQNWRRDFKKEFGREPLLWIDKYCVDQLNIEKSLSCLPVYLKGCQRLLLLCGSTYLQRLWCLVEILVFKEMGGLKTNLECRLLNGGEGMQECIQRFDVYKAKCFTECDTSRLLAVMEASADSLDELSDWIRSCLRSSMEEKECKNASEVRFLQGQLLHGIGHFTPLASEGSQRR